VVLCVNRVEATLPRSSQRCHLVLGGAHEEARRELPPDADPAGYVVILPDWGGLVSRRYGARRTGRAAAIVVVDEDSNITGSYQGERPVEAVLEMLERD
jgi:hypothetical protein